VRTVTVSTAANGSGADKLTTDDVAVLPTKQPKLDTYNNIGSVSSGQLADMTSCGLVYLVNLHTSKLTGDVASCYMLLKNKQTFYGVIFLFYCIICSSLFYACEDDNADDLLRI